MGEVDLEQVKKYNFDMIDAKTDDDYLKIIANNMTSKNPYQNRGGFLGHEVNDGHGTDMNADHITLILATRSPNATATSSTSSANPTQPSRVAVHAIPLSVPSVRSILLRDAASTTSISAAVTPTPATAVSHHLSSRPAAHLALLHSRALLSTSLDAADMHARTLVRHGVMLGQSRCEKTVSGDKNDAVKANESDDASMMKLATSFTVDLAPHLQLRGVPEKVPLSGISHVSLRPESVPLVAYEHDPVYAQSLHYLNNVTRLLSSSSSSSLSSTEITSFATQSAPNAPPASSLSALASSLSIFCPLFPSDNNYEINSLGLLAPARAPPFATHLLWAKNDRTKSYHASKYPFKNTETSVSSTCASDASKNGKQLTAAVTPAGLRLVGSTSIFAQWLFDWVHTSAGNANSNNASPHGHGYYNTDAAPYFSSAAQCSANLYSASPLLPLTVDHNLRSRVTMLSSPALPSSAAVGFASTASSNGVTGQQVCPRYLGFTSLYRSFSTLTNTHAFKFHSLSSLYHSLLSPYTVTASNPLPLSSYNSWQLRHLSGSDSGHVYAEPAYAKQRVPVKGYERTTAVSNAWSRPGKSHDSITRSHLSSLVVLFHIFSVFRCERTHTSTCFFLLPLPQATQTTVQPLSPASSPPPPRSPCSGWARSQRSPAPTTTVTTMTTACHGSTATSASPVTP